MSITNPNVSGFKRSRDILIWISIFIIIIGCSLVMSTFVMAGTNEYPLVAGLVLAILGFSSLIVIYLIWKQEEESASIKKNKEEPSSNEYDRVGAKRVEFYGAIWTITFYKNKNRSEIKYWTDGTPLCKAVLNGKSCLGRMCYAKNPISALRLTCLSCGQEIELPKSISSIEQLQITISAKFVGNLEKEHIRGNLIDDGLIEK